jgi:hypothetical protein
LIIALARDRSHHRRNASAAFSLPGLAPCRSAEGQSERQGDRGQENRAKGKTEHAKRKARNMVCGLKDTIGGK